MVLHCRITKQFGSLMTAGHLRRGSPVGGIDGW